MIFSRGTMEEWPKMKKETVDREGLFAHIRGRLISFQKAAGYSNSYWWANGIQESYTSADKAFLLRMPAVIVSGMLVWINSNYPLSRNSYALVAAPLASEWGDYIGKLISKETLIKNGYNEEDSFYRIESVKYTPASFIEDVSLFYDIIQNELKGKPFPSNKRGYMKQTFTTEIVMSIAKTLKEKYSWQINVLGRSNVPEEYRYIVNKYGEGKMQIAGLMDFSCLQLNIDDPFIGYKSYIKRFDKNNAEEVVDCSPDVL